MAFTHEQKNFFDQYQIKIINMHIVYDSSSILDLYSRPSKNHSLSEIFKQYIYEKSISVFICRDNKLHLTGVQSETDIYMIIKSVLANIILTNEEIRDRITIPYVNCCVKLRQSIDFDRVIKRCSAYGISGSLTSYNSFCIRYNTSQIDIFRNGSVTLRSISLDNIISGYTHIVHSLIILPTILQILFGCQTSLFSYVPAEIIERILMVVWLIVM